MSSSSVISMILLKIILAVAVVLVFSSGGVSSAQICQGTCTQFPDCDAHCKFLGYGSGTCIPFPLTQRAKCCCS